MSDCRQCVDVDWCAEHEDCGLFKQKPITNADRIRAMTDEELASILAQGCHETRDCPTMLSELFPYDEAVESCEKCWLDWLKEVEKK